VTIFKIETIIVTSKCPLLTTPLPNPNSNPNPEHPHVPYSLTPLPAMTSMPASTATLVTFHIPIEMIHAATSSPILACGGSFVLSECQAKTEGEDSTAKDGAVSTQILSSDPHQTAKEIGKRLHVRLGSQGASLRACPMQ
jgi:hypothetical protein